MGKILSLNKNRIFERGQLLVELLLAIGLSAIILPGIIYGIIATRDGRSQTRERMTALTYFKQANEAIRSVRERGWDNLYGPGTYYPVLSTDGKQWELATGSATVNGFTTAITISDVYRNNNVIVLSPTPGVLDPSTKRALINISWLNPFPSAVQSTIYLTRFLENDSYTETTQTHFNAGVKTGTAVRATNPPTVADDGEIVLGSGGFGNWCDPTLTSGFFDVNGNGVSTGIGAVEGTVLMSTGENASGPDLIKLGLNNPPQPTPPAVSELGTLDQNLKANDVFLEKAGETLYGYIGSDDNFKEVLIIDATSSPFTEVGTINLSGSNDVENLAVSGNLLYFSTERRIYTYDITNRASPVAKGQILLAEEINDLYVVGEYIYAANDNNSKELEIIQVTNNGATLTSVGYANTNSAGAKAVVVSSSGTRAYLATGMSSEKREFFIINLDAKNGSRPVVNTFELNGMNPKDITLSPGNRVIIVGHGGQEYQVINIDNENNLSQCGYEDTPDNINGVYSVLEQDGDAFSYIITTNSSKEFGVIVGGPGGNYAVSGTFESATFDPGYQTANNRFSANYSQPPNTSIKFQVTLAALVGGNCPNDGGYTFIGPDGTSASYFTPASGETVAFPLSGSGSYANPGQCFRYKAFLSTTDPNSTPVLNDFTINYSP